MRVKRFVVDSMPDALHQIRSDLGRDAVILNTKEIRSGGFLGLFSRKQIEVIAATDDQAKTPKPKPRPAPLSTVAIAEEAPAIHPLTSRPMAAAPIAVLDKPEETSSTTQLSAEIKQMKQMMLKLFDQGIGNNVSAELFHPIEQQLIKHEFTPELIQEIVLRALEQAELPLDQLTEQDARRLVKVQLQQLISDEQIQSIAAGTKIVHIVGPTGVGKTTTIAKLAADQVLKQGKKVGFITSDTYRIAAVEQLKTYATILNMPLMVVSSPQDLTKALDALNDRDIIFMDTAGRNFRNEMYVSELNSLLRNYENSETILTLSLTMKYKDMQAVTHNFSKFKLDKVLFTKKDETNTYGSIFNIAHEFSLQLSYITNGQNVPDDIATINIEEIIEHILEEQGNE